MKPLHYTAYLSNKINEAISKEIDITDDLLTQIQVDFRKLRNNKFHKENSIIVKRIKSYRNRIKIYTPALKVDLGYKDESYFSEEEMLLGYVAPIYEDLSKEEKEIWNELEKEKAA
tara:strand:- start:78 stop:425 length:348 start_codon:yes stop_codon:yes gene_type:complete